MDRSSSLDLDILHGDPTAIDPKLLTFYDYWRAAAKGGSMPTRADIDPAEMPRELLPYLFLVDVVDGGRRFKFRLVGTESAIAAGQQLTGRHIDEVNLSHAYAHYVSNLYRRVMERRRPVLSVSDIGTANTDSHITQRLLCPLSQDGETVSMVISCQVFDRPPANWTRVNLTSGAAFIGSFEAVVLA